jgi:TonB family protein
MNIESLSNKIKVFYIDLKTRHWPRLVAELEKKSLRHLFLWALLIGFILSVPWQCTRLIYNTYFSDEHIIQADQSNSLISPALNQGNITKMPNPRARQSIPQVEVQNTDPQNQTVDHIEPETIEALAVDGKNQEAKIIHQIPPKYPIEALRNNDSGVVLLRVAVLQNGNIGNISIDSSSGSRELDRAAKVAVQQWKFSPKFIKGIASDSELLIPIEFKAEQ